jgi:hypothetical protein
MARSVYFSNGTRSEQLTYEDIIVESISIFGQDFYYIPRTLVGKDDILGEDRLSKFKNAYAIEMYLESHDGFEGQGAFIQKFGLMMEQSATLTVARRTWERFVGQHGLSILPNRPAEGDLLYFPLTGGLFEIKFVKHQDPFYQAGKLYVYKLQVELFQYASEHMQTGIKEIDNFESLKSFDTEKVPNGTVTGFKITNKGHNYVVPPTVQVGDNWKPLASVKVNDEVCVDDRRYVCTIAGVTGVDAPTWTQSVGVDGTASWQFFGYRAYGQAYLGDEPKSTGEVVKILVVQPGSGYTYAPPVYLISNDSGSLAAANAIIANLDHQDYSYGDNNKFKYEAEGVIFSEANPFGELSTYYTPPLIQADTTLKTADSTTTKADSL